MILLIVTVGGIYGYDTLFPGSAREREGTVAELLGYQGDVRVKFSGEVGWQTGRRQQKLIYDDSVFSGPNSNAELRMGASQIKLEPNTLVVIRKDRNFSSLNLTYGNLSGTIAKGDHFVVESAAGEKFELKGTENSKINITRDQGKIVLKVLEGNAQFMKEGKVQNLSSRDEIRLNNQSKASINPLIFTSPQFAVRYSFEEKDEVDFAWNYSRADTLPAGPFTLEMSNSPSFTTIFLREELSEPRFSTLLHLPSDIYYRVKDSEGNFSETRRLTMAVPKAPAILQPHDKQAFAHEPGQSYPVNVTITAPSFESRAKVEVARDPQFLRVAEVRSGVASQYTFSLPAGKYFVRARLEYKQFTRDLSPMVSSWSEIRGFSIHERLDLDNLAKLRLPFRMIIPNKRYASALYKDDQRAREFLSQQEFFNGYFADVLRPGHELVMRNSEQAPMRRIETGYPAEWIKPGATAFTYQLETAGQISMPARTQELTIEMAPPTDLGVLEDSRLTWSPILFAKGYQVELKNGPTSQIYKSKGRSLKVPLEPGKRYAFRARAVGGDAQPISAWSKPFEFSPNFGSEPILANTAETEREPAQVEAISAIRATEKPNLIQKAIAWIWAGTGVNFLNVKQTINNTADVDYKNTKSGSIFLEGGWWFWKRWGAAFSYKRTPGEIRVDNYPINERAFIWDTYTAELLYGLPWVTNIFGYQIDYGLRAGLQKHAFPFLYVSSGNSLVQSQNEMVAGSLGFFAETAGRWKFHWNMRYQQPMSSSASGGNTFKISPIVGFDGLVGSSYSLTQRLKTGVFWYGQLHSYKFNYQSATQTNVGEQTLFYSNWEARLGLDF